MSVKMEDLVKMKMYSKVLGWDRNEEVINLAQKRAIFGAAFGGQTTFAGINDPNVNNNHHNASGSYNDFKRATGSSSTDMLSSLMCAQGNKAGCNVSMLNALGGSGGDSDIMKMLMLTQGR